MSAVVLWTNILRQMYRHSRIRVAVLAPISAVVVAAGILSSGLSVTFLASKLSNGAASIRTPAGSINIEDHLTGDGQWVAAIALSAVLNVLLGYGEQVFQLRLGHSFAVCATRRAMSEIGNTRTKLDFDPGILVRASASVAGSTGPIAKAIALGLVMSWIRWDLTITLVVGTLVLGVVLQGQVRSRILGVDERRRQNAPTFKDAVQTTTGSLLNVQDVKARAAIVGDFVDSAPFEDRVRLGLDIKEAQQRSSLVGGAVMTGGTICLTVVIATVSDDEAGRTTLVGLILFAVLIRMFYGSIQQLMAQLSTFHKYEHTLRGVLRTMTHNRGVEPGEVAFVCDNPPTGSVELRGWFDARGVEHDEHLEVRLASDVIEIEPSDTVGLGLRVSHHPTSILVVDGETVDGYRPGQIRKYFRMLQDDAVIVVDPDPAKRVRIQDALGVGVATAGPQLQDNGDEEWE